MDKESFYLLVNKHLTGSLSESERQLLDDWLDQSKENRSLFDDLTKIWEVSGKYKVDLNLDEDAAWQNVAARINEGTKKRSLISTHFFKVAASVLVLAVLGVLFYLSGNELTDIERITAQQLEHIMLPDGSEVWLNQNSEIEYPISFSEKRTVSLQGEAYFEVVRNASSPFTVTTAELTTTVLGTSFNVTAIEGQRTEEVVVMSGKVQVSGNDKEESVMLEAGTQARYDIADQDLVKSDNQNLNTLAWKDKKLKFRNTSLSDIELELERYFDIRIELESAQLGSCQFTSEFDNPVIEEVMEVLTVALDLQYTQEDGSYLIIGEGCNEEVDHEE